MESDPSQLDILDIRISYANRDSLFHNDFWLCFDTSLISKADIAINSGMFKPFATFGVKIRLALFQPA
jgi:hypothetical protein